MMKRMMHKSKERGGLLLMVMVAMGVLSVVGGTIVVYKHQQVVNQRKADEREKIAMIERSWAEVITSGKLPNVPDDGIHGLPVMEGLESPDYLSIKVVRQSAKPGLVPTAQISLQGAKTIPMAIGYMADPSNVVEVEEALPLDAWIDLTGPSQVYLDDSYTVSWTSYQMASGGDLGPWLKQDGTVINQNNLTGSVSVVSTEVGTVNFEISGWTALTPRDVRSDTLAVNVIRKTCATPVISPSTTAHVGEVTVTMSCATSGATIRYTTNGSDVTSSSTAYSGAFTLGVGDHTVKAKAFKSNYNDSAQASIVYNVAKKSQATVSISPASSTIYWGNAVTFTASGGSGSGAYTWGGSASGTGTTKSVTFSTPGTYTVTVYKAGDTQYNQSNTATATITVNKQNQTITASVSNSSPYWGDTVSFTASGGSGSGAYTWGGSASGTGTTKSVTCSTPGTYTVTVYKVGDSYYNNSNTVSVTATAQKKSQSTVSVSPASITIYWGNAVTFTASGGSGSGAYTWGGSASGTGTTKSVTFSTPGTYTVTVYKAGDTQYNQSNTATATITVNKPTCATPVISPSTTTGYVGSLSVTMSCATSGATIRYTTNGSDVTSSSTVYSGAFTLGVGTHTVKAKAFKSSYNDSAQASTTYTVSKMTPATVSILPLSQEIVRGNTIAFTASGGSGGGAYVWGGSASNNSLSSNNVYFSSAGTYSVTVYQAESSDYYASNTATSTISVVNPPCATPAISPSVSTGHVGEVTILMACATSGATIRYTTNGSDVTSSSPVYSGAFTLGAGTHTVKAKAYRVDYLESGQASQSYTVAPWPEPTVTYSIVSRYGFVPKPNRSELTWVNEPFVLEYTGSANGYVEVEIAWDNVKSLTIAGNRDYAYVPSSGISYTSTAYGTWYNNLTCTNRSGRVRVKYDGWNGAIQASTSASWYASQTKPVVMPYFIPVNYLYGLDGVQRANLSKGFYVMEYTAATSTYQVQPPDITPVSGTYSGSISVGMSCATSGATIRYTTNGSEPTSSSLVYSGAFTLGVGSYTIKAKAFKSGMSDSNTVQRSYTINSTSVSGTGEITGGTGGTSYAAWISTTTIQVTQGEKIKLDWYCSAAATITQQLGSGTPAAILYPSAGNVSGYELGTSTSTAAGTYTFTIYIPGTTASGSTTVRVVEPDPVPDTPSTIPIANQGISVSYAPYGTGGSYLRTDNFSNAFNNAWDSSDPFRANALSAYQQAYSALMNQEYTNASSMNGKTYTTGAHTATISHIQGEWTYGSNRGVVAFVIFVKGQYTP